MQEKFDTKNYDQHLAKNVVDQYNEYKKQGKSDEFLKDFVNSQKYLLDGIREQSLEELENKQERMYQAQLAFKNAKQPPASLTARVNSIGDVSKSRVNTLYSGVEEDLLDVMNNPVTLNTSLMLDSSAVIRSNRAPDEFV